MKYETEAFKIAVCDDELVCAREMENLICQCCEELQVLYEVKIYGSGQKLLNVTEETDLLFLDVEMKGIDGLQVKDELRQSDLVKKIVFVTSHAEYMQAAFGMKVIGFECKPVTKEMIQKWITVAMEELDSGWVTYQTQDGTYTASENEIRYLEADKDYVKLYLSGNENPVLLTVSMKQCERTFDTKRFLRVHKSYLVNMQFVQKINGNEIRLNGQERTIPIGRTYKNQAKERYEQYLKSVMRRRA